MKSDLTPLRLVHYVNLQTQHVAQLAFKRGKIGVHDALRLARAAASDIVAGPLRISGACLGLPD